MAQAGLVTNLLMMAFNLFPMPPLDGGRILFGLLPHKYAYRFAKLEPYGMFIVMALLYLPMLPFWDLWMNPVMTVAGTALNWLTSPLHTLIS
jgi:Zn-dependent protease